MTNLQLRPTGITADRNRKVMVIEWNDDHRSEYPFSGLREVCPCAQCRDEQAKAAAVPELDPFNIPLSPVKSTELVNVELVGNYALQITWGDGHRYGMYTWELLRGLCPCDHCREA